ncbi:hypothetical protein H113_05171 [Trichophyton rubrum MR1459]|nr:hypothetical protein H113_05171 [Trichophyton rubrum MR1459]
MQDVDDFPRRLPLVVLRRHLLSLSSLAGLLSLRVCLFFFFFFYPVSSTVFMSQCLRVYQHPRLVIFLSRLQLQLRFFCFSLALSACDGHRRRQSKRKRRRRPRGKDPRPAQPQPGCRRRRPRPGRPHRTPHFPPLGGPDARPQPLPEAQLAPLLLSHFFSCCV